MSDHDDVTRTVAYADGTTLGMPLPDALEHIDNLTNARLTERALTSHLAQIKERATRRPAAQTPSAAVSGSPTRFKVTAEPETGAPDSTQPVASAVVTVLEPDTADTMPSHPMIVRASKSLISVIVPAFNKARNLPHVIMRLPKVDEVHRPLASAASENDTTRDVDAERESKPPDVSRIIELHTPTPNPEYDSCPAGRGDLRRRGRRRATDHRSRRRALFLATAAVMVAISGMPSWVVSALDDASRLSAPSAQECGLNTSLHRFSISVGRECIGYSDSDELKFGSGKTLPEAQSRIFGYNRKVERLAGAGWRNPRVRLILLTALTSRQSLPEDEWYPAEREAMEGIAVAQAQALRDGKQTPTRPLLEVVVANVGQNGSGADLLVPKIRRLAEADPTVVGALVAMDSRTSTRTLMLDLQAQGLLVMTSTGAADRLRTGMTRFLQMQTTTREQARLVRAYANQIGRSAIVDFFAYGDPPPSPQNADLYVDDLREGLRREFAGGYEEGRWMYGTADLRARCRDRYDGIVYYGGRYTNFHGFLNDLYMTCGRENLPILVAAGNTARYVVGDPKTTGRDGAPSDYPLVFSSNGVASASCDPPNPTARQRLFLDAVVEVLGQCRDPADPEPLGVRTGPAFDIVTITLDAAAELAAGGATTISGAGLYAQIMKRNRRGPFYGVGGPIHFDDNGVVDGGGESLMCVRNIKDAYTRRGRDTVPYEIASTGAGGVPTTGEDICPTP